MNLSIGVQSRANEVKKGGVALYLRDDIAK